MSRTARRAKSTGHSGSLRITCEASPSWSRMVSSPPMRRADTLPAASCAGPSGMDASLGRPDRSLGRLLMRRLRVSAPSIRTSRNVRRRSSVSSTRKRPGSPRPWRPGPSFLTRPLVGSLREKHSPG